MDVVFHMKKGEELKVPYHASAAVTRDGNLPHVTATCHTWRQFASYCNAIYSSYNSQQSKFIYIGSIYILFRGCIYIN